jgi:uncharacterized membrane protein YgcG
MTMKQRALALGLVSATAGFVLAACTSGDEAASETAQKMTYNYPDGTPMPTTEWGDPDLQGMWPIMNLFSTPLQRNQQYGDREYLTDEEYQRAQGTLDSREAAYKREESNNQLNMGHWAESTTTSEAAKLTSLTVYPTNGQFPGLTARGEELRQFFGSDDTRRVYDSPTDDFDSWDRCITRGMPSSMLPFNYNNGIRIIQSPGFVVIDIEMIHESRIVPIDRDPLDPEIKEWMGESRGHWEGPTLVVETSNYNGKVGMTNPGIPGSPRGDTPSTTNMKTTERFTRVGEKRIDYELTIEDAEVLNDKWVIRYPMELDPTYRFFEYACHEDNTAVRNFIETSRYERAHPEEFPPAPQGGGFGGRGGRGGAQGGGGGGRGGFGGGRRGAPGGGAAQGAGAGQ